MVSFSIRVGDVVRSRLGAFVIVVSEPEIHKEKNGDALLVSFYCLGRQGRLLLWWNYIEDTIVFVTNPVASDHE